MLKELPEAVILTEVEKSILTARITGNSFFEYDQKFIKDDMGQIILRGSAMFGCPLPNTQFFAEILEQEVAEFILNFGYEGLTYNEVLLALRLNTRIKLRFPSGVEIEHVSFSGSFLSVDFLSKILVRYMTIRELLDRKIQNQLDGYPS